MAQDLGDIGPKTVRIAAAQNLPVEVDIDVQVGVARGAVQEPAPDARGSDVVDAAMEAFSGFRCDRGIHPVVGTTVEVVEGVCAHGNSGRGESATSRLLDASDD